MSILNFYHVRTNQGHVWSLRIKDRVWVLKTNKRKLSFKYYKLEYLDILGLYYEVGWIQNQTEQSQ
jgi:hypothetical protein